METKHLGKYYDLYLKSDTLLMADVFESFRKMCLKFHELDPAKFFFNSWISMGTSFKKNKRKIRTIN